MKKILLLVLVLFLTACTHRIQFTHFKSGETLNGTYDELSKTLTVVMKNGETLSGKYTLMPNASFSFGSVSAYSGTSYVRGYGHGITVGGTSKAYALLRSNSSKLMMEVIVNYSEWDGHGYGEARTNRGRKYKVQF